MQIQELFATAVRERIEPVVKVADRTAVTLYNELTNLVVTPQWEQHIRVVLDAYADAATHEKEQGVGIWISGFFGSGKSLLMKVLGMLLEGGDLQGKSVHDLFLSRLPAGSPDAGDIRRFLNISRLKLTTTAIGGNLHSMLTSGDDRLPLITFKLFADQRGYTHNWPFAWAVEYQIDARGQSDAFRQRAANLTGKDWEDLTIDPEIYFDELAQAASEQLPDRFASPAAVERAVEQVTRSGIDASRVVDRLRRWCEARDGNGRRHKLFLQLDEVGQWIAAGNANDRTMQVQALVEEAAQAGAGRIWLAVTAHGDIQELRQNVQQENYAKITQRFAQHCRLSNEDISKVVEQRVLNKTQSGRKLLTERFNARSGELTDLGRLERTTRVYPTPDAESFALFYPYLPWTVTVVPDMVKGIAQAAKRDEALSGSNRTMIGVVQGGLLETPGLLTSPVGRLISLSDLYAQLSSDVPVEAKTDLSRVLATVPNATPFTVQVAQVLYLMGQVEHIATTLDNVTLGLVDSLDAKLPGLRNAVREELRRLVEAGYAKQVGDRYIFLNTQQRSFQDKVRRAQDDLAAKTYDLIQRFKEKEFAGDNALRFDRVPLLGRELTLKLELDGIVIRNPSGTQVTVRTYSPLQRLLDQQIADDDVLRQRSKQEPNTILLRMAEVDGYRSTLALYLATDEVANDVLGKGVENNPEREAAQQARQDAQDLKESFNRLLRQAVRGAVIFFRGTLYQLAAGDGAGDAVRATLAQLLPEIYPRLAEVPQRIANEQTAVRAALQGNISNAELQALGVYKADGTLNENHVLLSTLRSRLPLADQDQTPINAAELRRVFEEPPYGWDGNVVKVGLALLLRAAACRLLDAGQVIADPASPRAEELLAKDTNFRNVRVQGVQSVLTMPELIDIRSLMHQIFQTPNTVALIAPTLNTTLAAELTKLATRAKGLADWASMVQCPLPLEFSAGDSEVQDLLNTGAAALRLRAFQDQAETVRKLVAHVTTLDAFRAEQSTQFSQMRDFFTSMVNVVSDIPALRTFIDDYRVVSRDRTITQPARWQEMVTAFAAARQAVEEQITAARRELELRLQGLDGELAEAVQGAGVPAAETAEQVEALTALYADVRARLAAGARTIGGIQSLASQLELCDLEREARLRELRAKYQTGNGGATGPAQLTWHDLTGGAVTLTSAGDVQALLDRLAEQLDAALAQHPSITIE